MFDGSIAINYLRNYLARNSGGCPADDSVGFQVCDL